MKVAALYDVHGNVHALEAVVAELGDADVVLFGGDLVSGPLPRETLELARSLDNAQFILGNADLLTKQLPRPEWDEARPIVVELLHVLAHLVASVETLWAAVARLEQRIERLEGDEGEEEWEE